MPRRAAGGEGLPHRAVGSALMPRPAYVDARWSGAYVLVEMIHDVDDALRALIEDGALEGDVEVAFDAPTREWASRRSVPTVNVFLYDIREDLSRRDVAPQTIRNDQGHVIERRPPVRRFKLSYLLTAWTQRPRGRAPAAVRAPVEVPRVRTPSPSSTSAGRSRTLRSRLSRRWRFPRPRIRSLSDIWSALGGELKPSLDLIVVAPFDPLRGFHVGPPVLEGPRLDLDQDDGGGKGKKKAKVAAGPPIEPLDDGSGGERLVAGNDEEPGRTLVIRPNAKA